MRLAVHLSTLICLSFLVHPAAGQKAAPDADAKSVSCVFQYTMTPKGTTKTALLTAQFPQTLPGRQKVTDIRYSVKPQQEIDGLNTVYAQFAGLNMTSPILVTVEVDVETYRCDLETVGKSKSLREALSDQERRKHLAHEKFLEKDSPEIQKAAKQIVADGEIATVREILTFVKRTLRYNGFNPDDKGAVRTLADGQGDCSDFSDVFIALCRAKGLPARPCSGCLTIPIRPGDTAFHDWAEVYLKELGWVPVDPLHASQGSSSLERGRNKYIYLCRGDRLDPVLRKGHIHSFRFTGSPIEVKREFRIASLQPLAPSDMADRPAYRPKFASKVSQTAAQRASEKARSQAAAKSKPTAKPPPSTDGNEDSVQHKPEKEVDDEEKSAQRKLNFAKQLLEDGKNDRARQRLQDIVDHHGKTAAAREARKLLKTEKE
jgi:hypothetical protein